uniref:Uncharacterized protein n=1 Tax=Ascaris lumbricoides TaxID=6252 RepID=A0A0M3HSS9_ASCLU
MQELTTALCARMVSAPGEENEKGYEGKRRKQKPRRLLISHTNSKPPCFYAIQKGEHWNREKQRSTAHIFPQDMQ